MSHRKEHTKAYRDSTDSAKRAAWKRADDEAWAKKGGRPQKSEGDPFAGLPPEFRAAVEEALAQGGADDSDEDVYVGGEWDSDAWGTRWLEIPGYKKKQSKYESDFYRMDESQLEEFQRKAFAAGLYGTDDPDEVPFGDYDERSAEIWAGLGKRSSAFLKAGKMVSPMQVLEQITKTKTKQKGAQKQGDVIEMPDPALLRETISFAVMKAVGQRPDEATLNRYAAEYEAKFRETEQKKIAIGESGATGEVTGLPTAEQYAYLRTKEERPTDVAATAVNERADEFFGLLGAFNSAGE